MAGFTVTLACADPLCLGNDIEAARRGGAAGVHIDIMDGRYVPNLCMSFAQAGAIKESYPSLEMDIHMMVADPFCWVEELVRLQPQRVAVHLDSTPFTYRFLERMKAAGISPGVAWNPSQPLELLFPLARRIEYVLLMAVEPGFSGQSMDCGTGCLETQGGTGLPDYGGRWRRFGKRQPLRKGRCGHPRRRRSCMFWAGRWRRSSMPPFGKDSLLCGKQFGKGWYGLTHRKEKYIIN